MRFERVLLKLSGEVLAGPNGFGFDLDAVRRIGEEIVEVVQAGMQVAMVVGGGNMLRGREVEALGVERAQADYMGMLASVMNALCLQDSLEKLGVPTRVQTAIEMRQIAEPYIRRRALRHLEKGRVVIFAAGTGSPYFSTDTAAALRAAEVEAQCLLKATKVDGIYSADPKKNPDAVLLHRITYGQALRQRLEIMDAAAFSLCMENTIPIVVLNILRRGNLKRFLIEDHNTGTVVSGEEDNYAKD
ncbi:MAG TPA: UMP kinase [Synergistaceae bacterium]|nr:UMP kinase [Synergistaceae bacterium]